MDKKFRLSLSYTKEAITEAIDHVSMGLWGEIKTRDIDLTVIYIDICY
jgi:hypothetical protein